MRQPGRTIVIKTILFILCVIMFLLFAGASLSLIAYLDEEIPFYTGTVDELTELADDPAIKELLCFAYELRYAVFWIIPAALILFVLCFVILLKNAGHRPGTEELVPGPLNRVPPDIMTIAVGLICFGTVMGFWAILESCEEVLVIVSAAAGGILLVSLLIGWSLYISVKAKQHAFFSSCIIVRVIKFLWHMLVRAARYFAGAARSVPLVRRTFIVIATVSALEFIVMVEFTYQDQLFIFWGLEKLILVPLVIYLAVALKKLAKGGEALAAGELSYHTDTSGMYLELKKHGENLNSIGSGLSIALEDKLRSERMKTELITNVSHDIKTPLTSIINYAGLIGEENCDNPKITEYSEVLVRQSQKLKRLIEDLIEASKASTGNLDVQLAECDAAVFVNQASGEYEDKLRQAELTLVTKLPGEELKIMADGRRMWRVFDNLMNNICKYAQPGTRVYLSLEKAGKDAVITFKNTSKDELDLTPDELMERFARGDRSRNTEGNGLGLSIAKSFAELQGGKLQLAIDGDLFKAMLNFPLAE